MADKHEFEQIIVLTVAFGLLNQLISECRVSCSSKECIDVGEWRRVLVQVDVLVAKHVVIDLVGG